MKYEKQPQFFWKWKMTSILKNGLRPQFFGKWKTNIEDYLIFWKWKTTSFYFVGRWPQYYENGSNLNFLENGRLPKDFENGSQPYFNIFFHQKKDDLNILKIVRWSQKIIITNCTAHLHLCTLHIVKMSQAQLYQSKDAILW